MENANYIFQITPYDTNNLLSQVSKAFEKRTELVSREQYPGLVKPQELLVPLIGGAIAICVGISGLVRNRKNRKNPFDKSAKLLLQGKDSISPEPAILVTFSETGMTIPTENASSELVPYDNFECVIETADLFLFVYDERVTLLQEVDLTTDNVENFRKFLSEKVGKYQSITS